MRGKSSFVFNIIEGSQPSLNTTYSLRPKLRTHFSSYFQGNVES